MALMTPAEKNSLVKNRLHLLDNVHLNEEFYSLMMEDHSLTASMIEEIRVIDYLISLVFIIFFVIFRHDQLFIDCSID
jgi:hypothetical protein